MNLMVAKIRPGRKIQRKIETTFIPKTKSKDIWTSKNNVEILIEQFTLWLDWLLDKLQWNMVQCKISKELGYIWNIPIYH